MPVSSLELRQKKAKLVHDARDVYKRAEDEKRDLSAEDQGVFDRLMTDAEKLDSEIERMEKLETIERSLSQSQGRVTTASQPGAKPDEVRGEKPKRLRETDEYRDAFNRYLMGGREEVSYDELRALQADSQIAGGYTVAPEQFMNDLIIFVNNMVFMRGLARIEKVTNAQSLGVPALDNDPADSDWTSELNTGSEDSTMTFGKRELIPHPVAKRIKVSNKLLRLSTGSESLVRERLAYKFGVTLEKAYLLGSGTNQPLGIFTASNNGVPTGQDVSTGNTATAVQADNLFNVKFSLKFQHQQAGVWIFNRTVIRDIMKLKDGEGRYLWQPGLTAGTPNTLLDRPVYMSEYAPNTMTTGLYVGAFFNPAFYWIADSITLEMQRLVELYAEANQVGLIGRWETDGMPVLSEAFARVALA